MRSKLGLAASVAALVTYPAAIAAGLRSVKAPPTAVVHFVLGSAFVLLAAAMFDFGLNRWVTWLGATAAAVFGGTFLLQGVADLTNRGPRLAGLRRPRPAARADPPGRRLHLVRGAAPDRLHRR